jgi:hypothetical protein
MKIKEFKKALLVALLHSQRKKGLNQYIEPKDAAAEYNLEYPPGQIRLCVTEFKDHGLVRAAFTMGGGPDGGLACSLTASGVEEAEEIEATFPELLSSKRFIEPGTKAQQIDELKAKVGELKESVKENRDNDFTDKAGRLAEILALELLLAQPQISVPLVEKIIQETVYLLGQKFADKAIGMAAGAVLVLAAQALGIRIPH